MHGAWVQSLVRELRSHMPCSIAKKLKKKKKDPKKLNPDLDHYDQIIALPELHPTPHPRRSHTGGHTQDC